MVAAWLLDIGQAEMCRHQSMALLCQWPTIFIMLCGTFPRRKAMVLLACRALVEMSDGHRPNCGLITMQAVCSTVIHMRAPYLPRLTVAFIAQNYPYDPPRLHQV
eukprot:1187258-Ditylum_brightwellii.AAC.1